MGDKDKIKAFKVVFTTIKAAYEIHGILSKKKGKSKEIKTICDNVLTELGNKKPNLEIVTNAMFQIELIVKQPERPTFANGGIKFEDGECLMHKSYLQNKEDIHKRIEDLSENKEWVVPVFPTLKKQ